MKTNTLYKQVEAALLGGAIGDALGVPVEFESRENLKQDPVKDMRAYGTYRQPKGTFSDDSSMTFCLAEALTTAYDLQQIADNFVDWYRNGFWTAQGTVFDIGIATKEAIERIENGENPKVSGGFDERSNGNGSLMRILPLVFYVKNKSLNERYEIVKEISSITHMHVRSVMACFYYIEFARLILEGENPFDIYKQLQKDVSEYFTSLSINTNEIVLFDRILKENIYELPEKDIRSSGYVLHSLEASLWCLLTSTSYSEVVLKAVNLGEDTDTTAAISGGLAGMYYGTENIPNQWINDLARTQDIKDLARRLAESYLQ